MSIDSFDSFDVFDKKATGITESIPDFSNELGLDIRFDKPIIGFPESRYDTLAFSNWVGPETAALLVSNMETAIDGIKQMYSGVTLENGLQTLGLKEISNWKLNEQFYDQNIKQQAGYVAEVISTAKENIKAIAERSGIRTFRADDLPDLFAKNDQYVDKVRMDANGNILERIQVKFVGNNGTECLNKLMSKDFDKYFLDGKVDKMEIPKEFYDEIRSEGMIQKRLENFTKQLEAVEKLGKTDVAEKLQAKIDKLNKIDQMLERSNTSCKEAISARKHPLEYTSRILGENMFAQATEAGIKSGLGAAAITVTVSTVDNVQKVLAGEETAVEAFKDVAVDTGAAAGIAGVSTFITTTVAETMKNSGNELLKSIGGGAIPVAVVSFGVQSFDSVVSYAKGEITGGELAYDLGENASRISGSMAGAAIGAAALGAVPVAGPVVGGIVGGLVGTVVTGEAYKTAVEFGEKNVGPLAEKLQATATGTLDKVKEFLPEKVTDVKEALNQFAAENELPFSV